MTVPSHFRVMAGGRSVRARPPGHGPTCDAPAPVRSRRPPPYSLDIGASREELGYEPLVPFTEGLADTIDWYRHHTAWWRPLLAAATAA